MEDCESQFNMNKQDVPEPLEIELNVKMDEPGFSADLLPESSLIPIPRRFTVNSSHGLKAGASLLLPGCCAVIALWHRGTFCGNFRFPFHWPKLTSDSRCSGSDLIGHIRGVPSLQLRVYRHATHLIRAQIFQVAL